MQQPYQTIAKALAGLVVLTALAAIAASQLTQTQPSGAPDQARTSPSPSPMQEVSVTMVQLPRPQAAESASAVLSGSGTTYVEGTAREWRAYSTDSSLPPVSLLRYEHADGAADLPNLSCWGIRPANGPRFSVKRCARVGDPGSIVTRMQTDQAGSVRAVALWDAPDSAVRLKLVTSDGTQVTAEILDGTSYASWPTSSGVWSQVVLLDTGGTEIWSRVNE